MRSMVRKFQGTRWLLQYELEGIIPHECGAEKYSILYRRLLTTPSFFWYSEPSLAEATAATAAVTPFEGFALHSRQTIESGVL